MKYHLKNAFLAVVLTSLALLTISYIDDVQTFHFCLNNKSYSTPWFDNRWIKSPYTNFRLLFGDSKHYITTNAVGDIWVCREVRYRGKDFWTIDFNIKKEDYASKTKN